MFASVIDIKFKPGSRNQYLDFAQGVAAKLEGIPGIRECTIVDRGDDSSLALVAYDSRKDWEAAAPKAQEILGGLADIAAAPPKRVGGEVVVNRIY